MDDVILKVETFQGWSLTINPIRTLVSHISAGYTRFEEAAQHAMFVDVDVYRVQLLHGPFVCREIVFHDRKWARERG